VRTDTYVVTVQPESNGADPRIFPRVGAGWLDILAAGVDGHEIHLVLGKRQDPGIEKGDAIVILSGGMIRCRVVCAGMALSVFGDAIVLSGAEIVKAAHIGVSRDALLTRWEETFKKPPPTPLTFPGARATWWHKGDEQPFPDWAGAGLPPEVAEAARSLVKRFGSARQAEKPVEKAEKAVVGIGSGGTKASLVPTVVARAPTPASGAVAAIAVAPPVAVAVAIAPPVPADAPPPTPATPPVPPAAAPPPPPPVPVAAPAPEPKAKRAKAAKAKPEATAAPGAPGAAPPATPASPPTKPKPAPPTGQGSLF
jgi:hypothetical protein